MSEKSKRDPYHISILKLSPACQLGIQSGRITHQPAARARNCMAIYPRKPILNQQL